MRALLQDVRMGVRMLRKDRGFTAVATITLAVAIGANVAIFSVVEGILLQPLPYAEPDDLVIVFGTSATRGTQSDPVSPPDFEDWRSRSRSFRELAAHSYWTFNLTGGDGPERLLGSRTSGNMLEMLGARAVVGRVYSPGDDKPGAEPVAVLGYGLWHRRFGGDPSIVGRTIALNEVNTTVIGVLGPEFRFPDATTEVWAPLADELEGTARNARMLVAVGRLAPQVSLAQAQADVATVAEALEREFPDSNTGRGVRVASMHDTAVGDVRPALLLLQASVALVLVVACANVTNLMLARAAARRREIAIRAALGARRRRLVRQLLTESLLLSAVAGVGGVLLALAFVRLALAFGPGDVPRFDEVGLDPAVLVFALALTALTGLVSGLWPALVTSRGDVAEALKASGPTTIRRRSRLKDGIVVAEIALSLVLLVGGGLLASSFAHVAGIDLGFQPDNVLTLQVFLTGGRYREVGRQHDFVRDVVARIAALPGVESVGASTHLPLGGPGTSFAFFVEGRGEDPASPTSADYRSVHPDYFRTMRIPLLGGRSFTSADDDRAPRVVAVNETLARRTWPGEDAVGKRIRWANMPQDSSWCEVVGVVANVRTRGLEVEEGPAVYAPYPQRTVPFMRWMAFAVRTTPGSGGLAAAVRDQIRTVDPDRPVYDVKTMSERIGGAIAPRRFAMLLVSALAGVGLLLATIGLYGVINYTVGQRVPEIGLRMALGAERRHIAKLVLGHAIALVGVGVVAGILAALAVADVISGMLYGVQARDPATIVGVTALLVCVALAACLVPARRATRVDPMVALKVD
jgi:putative ABC transport system permease protein